jgi:hypothetical protein
MAITNDEPVAVPVAGNDPDDFVTDATVVVEVIVVVVVEVVGAGVVVVVGTT